VPLRADRKIDLMRRVPLFSECSHRELRQIAALADEIDFPEGRELIREGDRGREFFVVVEGTAEVRRRGRRIDTLGPGDFAGEMALLTRTPRNATVKTTSPVRALVLAEREFRSLLDHSPQVQVKVLLALAERLAPQSL
jgi:CRP-like cAMP-binding protein